jgi:hypothetical protein
MRSHRQTLPRSICWGRAGADDSPVDCAEAARRIAFGLSIFLLCIGVQIIMTARSRLPVRFWNVPLTLEVPRAAESGRVVL